MRNLLLLTKINLINQFNLNKLFKKQNIFAKILVSLLILVGVVIIFGYVFFLYMAYALLALELDNSLDGILTLGIFFSVMVLIVTSLSRANAYLFKARDFDLLVAMPLPLRTIVFSKILSFVFVSYLPIFFTFVPSVVVYLMYVTPHPLFYPITLLVFFLLPLLLIAVLSFGSYLLALLVRRFKHKNIFATLFYFVFFIGVMFFTLQIPGENTSLDLFAMVSEQLQWYYYPGFLAQEALLGNYLFLLYFLLISVLPFLLFTYFTGKHYVAINTRLAYSGERKVATYKAETSSQGAYLALLQNEFRRLISLPILAMNTLIGKIMLPLLIIIFHFSFKQSGELPIAAFEEGTLSLIMLAIILFSIGLNAIATTSISLEGKKFWILKGSPVTFETITLSKISLDLITTVIILIPSAFMAVFLLKIDLISTFLLVVITVVYALFSALLGYILNLFFPRMDWELPVKVVKQSASVSIHVLSSFIILAVVAVLSLMLGGTIYNAGVSLYSTSLYVMLFVLGLALIFVTLAIMYLRTRGEKRFYKIKA